MVTSFGFTDAELGEILERGLAGFCFDHNRHQLHRG